MMQKHLTEQQKHDLHLRAVALGEVEGETTGYPSKDKPWLKYYDSETICKQLAPNTIYNHLWENNKNDLDDVALIYFNQKINYKLLFKKIQQCADSFVALGIKQGDIVTIQALAIPQTVVLVYALSYIGAIANLIYVTSNEEEVNTILKETNSQLYFVMDRIYEKFNDVLRETSVKKTILLSLETEMDFLTKTAYHIFNRKQKYSIKSKDVIPWVSFLKMKPSAKTECALDASLPVVMVYTGGTTGTSKAVVLTNRSMNELVFQYEKANMGFVRQKVFMDSLPPFIAFGLTVSLHLPLCMGIKTVLIADPTPQNQGTPFFKYKPNYYVASPIQISSIINHPKASRTDFSFLKILATGGDALPASSEKSINDFLKKHNCETSVFQGYGMFELSATVCTGSPSVLRFGTVGIPLPNTEAKITDTDSGEELTYGQAGEVCICAPSVMIGYFKAKDATDQIMKTHDDGKLWVHTGDIGVMDHDGFLSIIGRLKRIITIFDGTIYHKVYPKLLEEQLETIPNVLAAVIVSNGTYVDEQELIAYIVSSENNVRLESTIRQFAAEKFKVYERPSRYQFIDELPRTKIGKVDYRALEQKAAKA